MNIGICGYFPEDHRMDAIEAMNSLVNLLYDFQKTFKELASLIEECGYLLYYEPTPPKEYARARSKSRRDLYRRYEGDTDVYIRITPKNLPYMRRPH